MTRWIDNLNQERCDEIEDLSFAELTCAARRIHTMDSQMQQVPAGTTFPGMQAVKQLCECGRWRRRTFHPRTHELLTVAYGGGVILTGDFNSYDVWYAYVLATLRMQRTELVAAAEL